MIQRRTQTAAYWEEEFSVDADDVSRIYSHILDSGRPVSAQALAELLIERRCRQEEEKIRAKLSNGRLYQPKDTYEEGEELLFPALGFARGTVVGLRPGSNPEYGDFTAIQVNFGGETKGAKLREFASGLTSPHALDRAAGREELLAAGDLMGIGELYEAYGGIVEDEIEQTLSDHKEFVLYKDAWFLKELLVPVEEGHLFLAEALIEVRGMPTPPPVFLPDLSFPAEVPEEVQILSLNIALDRDKRFDNIGDSGRDIWYLRRLIPRPVVEPPARLKIQAVPYDRRRISDELLAIEREIDDEASGEEVWGPGRRIFRATLSLIYPHRRCGTLPLTVRTRSLFPEATRHHTPVVLVDGQTGSRMQGWIVHRASFVYGLADWYEEYKLPVGARIKLERTRDPRVITVDFEPERLQPTWIALTKAAGNKLVFQMRKAPIACAFDEHLAIADDDPNASDALWSNRASKGTSLLEIMDEIMPALIQLSPEGRVHAKTVYSAVNVLMRVAPGPIFALLSTEPRFVALGGGYWTYDAASER